MWSALQLCSVQPAGVARTRFLTPKGSQILAGGRRGAADHRTQKKISAPRRWCQKRTSTSSAHGHGSNRLRHPLRGAFDFFDSSGGLPLRGHHRLISVSPPGWGDFSLSLILNHLDHHVIGSGVPGASATGAQSKNPVESAAVILVLKNAARRSTGFFDYVAPTFPRPLR